MGRLIGRRGRVRRTTLTEMEAHEPQCSMTPTEDHHLSSNTQNLYEQSSPSQMSLETSSYDILEEISSAQAVSSSRRQYQTSIRSLFSKSRSASSASQHSGMSSSPSRPGSTSTKCSISHSIARSESPRLSQIGSKLDSYRPTRPTYAAHVDRARSKQRNACRLPPLFQTYPQSLQTVLLDAPRLSADVILRNSHPKDVVDSPSSVSALVSTSGWAKQLFVLVTSGYLLQYAGGGHIGRLPERVMELGKNTVAFASDAIPGRHWVLQVSQATEEDTTVVSDSSKRVRSRIGVQNAESPWTAQNLLLVFDDPGDLHSWLTLIRAEIGALGGLYHRPETGSEEKPNRKLEHRLSPKIRVQEDPHQLSTRSEIPKDSGGQIDDGTLDFQSSENEATASSGTEGSSTTTSTDLDRLLDSKDSSLSTDIGPDRGFHNSSPAASPVGNTFALAPSPSFVTRDASDVVDVQVGRTQGSPMFERTSPTSLLHPPQSIYGQEGGSRVESLVDPSNATIVSASSPNHNVSTSSMHLSVTDDCIPSMRSSTQDTAVASLSVPNEEEVKNLSSEKMPRPSSNVAPLPDPEALMGPAGFGNRNAGRRSPEQVSPTQAVHVSRDAPQLPHDTSRLPRPPAHVQPPAISPEDRRCPTASPSVKRRANSKSVMSPPDLTTSAEINGQNPRVSRIRDERSLLKRRPVGLPSAPPPNRPLPNTPSPRKRPPPPPPMRRSPSALGRRSTGFRDVGSSSRCNSCHAMIHHAYSLTRFVAFIIQCTAELDEDSLSDEDWQKLFEIERILKPFRTVTARRLEDRAVANGQQQRSA